MKTFFMALVFTLAASTYVDYAMSYNAISTGRYSEGNTLTKSFVMHPEIALPIITITNAGFCFGMEGLYKDSKTAGWIVVGMIALVKGYVIWHNLRVLRH